MNKTYILILALVPLLIYPQQNDKALAKIGNIEISEQQFLERYELTPVLGKEIKSDEQALKKEVLYSLIAEKLFSLAARDMNLDTAEVVSGTLQQYKKIFVRDALYKKEIKDKAKNTADSLLNDYIRKASEVWFTFIAAQNENEINNIYEVLNTGVPFDSVSTMFNKASDTLKTRVGDHDPAIENIIFNTAESRYTKPLEMNGIWYILKIVKRINPVLTHLNGWEQEYKRLLKIAEERAEGIYYKKYMSHFFSDKTIKADGNLLKDFAAEVSIILSAKAQSRKSDTDKVFINNIDLLKIENELKDKKLNENFCKLNGTPVKFKDFISYFKFEQIGTSMVDYNSVLNLLNSKTRQFIEQELLAEEGFKEGLDKLPEVQEHYNMWRDNYYFYIVQSMFNDSTSVSDVEAMAYYKEEGNKDNLGDEVRVAQIFSDSLQTMETILNELDAGKSFEEIAKRYGLSESSDEYFPVSALGEVGRLSENMKVGDVYGPIKAGDQYVIFKLIDRRRKQQQNSFESEEKNIKNTLAGEKFQKKITDYTTSLAMKYGISINENLLSQLNVTHVNTMAYQLLGFGGKIPAVPLSLPQIQWYKQWKEKHDIIQ